LGEKGEQEGGLTIVKIAHRWSGEALVAAALVVGAAMVLVSHGLPGRFPTPLVSLLLLMGSILLMLALPGM
jgi:hypothetical protein